MRCTVVRVNVKRGTYQRCTDLATHRVLKSLVHEGEPRCAKHAEEERRAGWRVVEMANPFEARIAALEERVRVLEEKEQERRENEMGDEL